MTAARVEALGAWALKSQRVPPGHPLDGQPMGFPPLASEFLRAGWNAYERALSTARKNAKSSILAILVLGFLAGPLRVNGWRGAIASLSKEKANELLNPARFIRTQIETFAAGLAALDGCAFGRRSFERPSAATKGPPEISRSTTWSRFTRAGRRGIGETCPCSPTVHAKGKDDSCAEARAPAEYDPPAARGSDLLSTGFGHAAVTRGGQGRESARNVKLRRTKRYVVIRVGVSLRTRGRSHDEWP